MFIAVCTCSSSRAIRLDIVPDASCSSFICSLKRFISINGVTDLYIKDNAKWFSGLELKDYLSKSSTSCCYILEVSPWWGGFCEWVVQVFKRSLWKFFCWNQGLCMKNYSLLFVRSSQGSIQGCYVYDDDIEKVIMPSHLLLGQCVSMKFNSDFNEKKLAIVIPDRQIKRSCYYRRSSYIQIKVENQPGGGVCFEQRWV